MQTCQRCKGFYWKESCDCEEFTIQFEEENYKVYAGYADQAAEKFAETQLVNGEYYFLGGCIEFLVNGKPYRVGTKESISYSVNEL